jgi:hypothetical protein
MPRTSPARTHKLTDSQRVPEGHQDQQPVADRVATLAAGGQQLLDVGFRQVFALPVIGVLGSTTTNCRLFRL